MIEFSKCILKRHSGKWLLIVSGQKDIFLWFKLCFIHIHTCWWENLGENNTVATSHDLQCLGWNYSKNTIGIWCSVWWMAKRRLSISQIFHLAIVHKNVSFDLELMWQEQINGRPCFLHKAMEWVCKHKD